MDLKSIEVMLSLLPSLLFRFRKNFLANACPKAVLPFVFSEFVSGVELSFGRTFEGIGGFSDLSHFSVRKLSN